MLNISSSLSLLLILFTQTCTHSVVLSTSLNINSYEIEKNIVIHEGLALKHLEQAIYIHTLRKNIQKAMKKNELTAKNN